MKTLLLLFFGLFGIGVFAADQTDVIRPTMTFPEASLLLKKYKAEPTVIQVTYPDEKKNRKIEHFILADGRTIELSMTRKKRKAEWIIDELFEVVWKQPERNREKQWLPLKEVILKEPIKIITAQRASRVAD